MPSIFSVPAFIGLAAFALIFPHSVSASPGGYAIVSNACKTTIYVSRATSPAGSAAADRSPLAPGAYTKAQISTDSATSQISPTSDSNSALQLEYAISGSNMLYDLSNINADAFKSEGFKYNASVPSCPSGSCAQNESNCPALNKENSCSETSSSVTLTVCAS